MIVNSLILEVTRRCNMSCEHCLRGDAQALDMSREIVDRILEPITSIYSLVFTGGEPTLNLPIMQYTLKQIKKRKIDLGAFYICTNGKKIDLEFLKFLCELYAACNDKESCGLDVSQDQYHEKVDVRLYEAFTFFHKENRTKPYKPEYTLCEGRASDNGIGWKYLNISDEFEVELDEEPRATDTVYIAANGNVTNDCDFSYEHVDDEYCRGNVLEKSLQDIVLGYRLIEEAA